MKNLKLILIALLAFLTVGVINVKADTGQLTTNAGGLEDIIYNAAGKDRTAVSCEGNTVTLLKDVTISDKINFKLYSEVIFDLNGHKLSIDSYDAEDMIYLMDGSKKLTIKSGINTKGVLYNPKDDVINVQSALSTNALELDNIEIQVLANNAKALYMYNSIVDVKSVKFSITGSNANNGVISVQGTGKGSKLNMSKSSLTTAVQNVDALVINCGDVTLTSNTIDTQSTYSYPIKVNGAKAKLNIVSGSYSSAESVLVYSKGEVTITDGSLYSSDTSLSNGAILYNPESTTGTNSFTINGGTVAGAGNGIYSQATADYGDLKVTDGEIIGYGGYGIYVNDYSDMTLNGGEYTGKVCGIIKASNTGVNVKINKGVFTADGATGKLGGICSSVTKNPLAMVTSTSRYDKSEVKDNGVTTYSTDVVKVAPKVSLGSYTKEFTYNKNVQGPTIVITDAIGGTLVEDKDYRILGDDTGTDAGDYDFTIKFDGVYEQFEDKPIHFDINPAQITTSIEKDHYVYNGRVESPLVEVTALGDTLANVNSDFSDDNVEISYPEGRKNAGTYKVIIVGKGNYTGNKIYNIVIDRAPITSSISGLTFTYDGKVKTPTVLVKANTGVLSNTNKNVNTEDVKVTYQAGRTKVGTYTVKVEGLGNYIGTKTFNMVINPMKTTIKSIVFNKKNKVTVNVNKKTKEVTGYEAIYSTNKNFKNAKTKTVKKNTNTTLTIKKLSYNTKYYVKVRTYKVVNGKTYYSAWSKVKTFKTQKK